MRYVFFSVAVAAVLSASCSEIRIVADFRGETPPGRAMRDIKYPCDLSGDKALAFDFMIEDRDEFAHFLLHFDCDGKWAGTPLHVPGGNGWSRVVVKRPKPKPNGVKHDWSKVRGFRISGWRGGTNRTYLAVKNISVVPVPPEKKPTKEELEIRKAAVAETNRMALAELAATPAPEGERRMMWEHQPAGIKGRSWDYSVRLIKKCGFTDLIVNLARGPVAAYKSDVLAPARMFEGRDYLEECMAACRRHGVKIHVWTCCWRTGWGMTDADIAKFVSEGRVQKIEAGETGDGKVWLCPSHPENRRMLVDSMVELAGKGVDGVHFDFIRYPDVRYCFCDGCRARFENKIGMKVSDWPQAVRKDPVLDRKWREFRRDVMTAPVAEVSKRIRREFPGVETSAAVYTTPLADWDWVGQDWPSWCENGYLDFVCPMTYSGNIESYARAQRKLERQLSPKVRRYPGIGLDVWPRDGLAAARFAQMVTYLRKSGGKGFTLFDLGWKFVRISDDVAKALGQAPDQAR